MYMIGVPPAVKFFMQGLLSIAYKPETCNLATEEALLCEQAKESAIAAVRAATDSASLALQAVETSVQHYVETRDYMRLKDMAEASAVAGQVPAHDIT